MFVDVDRYGLFALPEDLLARYRDRPVPWGFGDLSRITFLRTYSRGGERWWETCRRVIEGTLTVLRAHSLSHGLPFDDAAARRFGERAFERMWSFKWTPPGRGLWIMGTRFLYERGGAALNNCGFASTRDVATDFAAPFVWMFRMSMLGVGVGFDTRGGGSVTIQKPGRSEDEHVIPDSREGWAEALRRLLAAHTGSGSLPTRWDFGKIRPRGAPLESFGGVASGPEPLKRMLHALESLYGEYVGRKVDSRLVVDTMDLVGRCVVAGGIRRASLIALGDPDDLEFLDLKSDQERLRDYRWVSNHSLFATSGMDYREPSRRSIRNGEPGYLWLENARRFGRLADPENHADAEALGTNPCAEQTLFDRELCCLVETYPARHDSFADYLQTLEIAYRYAKIVTLVPTGVPSTDEVMARNRRIGCSMTGVVQAIRRHGPREFFGWCDRGYRFLRELDVRVSEELGVPRSIKLTSVKPSGTVSILAGATPGVHWEHAPYYIRRVRLSQDHPLAEGCRAAGYAVEPDAYAAETVVVSFPVHIPHLDRAKAEVPVREKVDLAAEMQRHWSDNQVSCTAEFDPATEAAEIPRLLETYEDRLKAIGFLPSRGHGYDQPPYETITKDEYREMTAKLRPVRGQIPHENELEERFCEGGLCHLP